MALCSTKVGVHVQASEGPQGGVYSIFSEVWFLAHKSSVRCNYVLWKKGFLRPVNLAKCVESKKRIVKLLRDLREDWKWSEQKLLFAQKVLLED